MSSGTFSLRSAAKGARRWKSTKPSLAARRPASRQRRGYAHKNTVLSLVERGGPVRSSFHVDSTRKADILPIVKANIAKESRVMTDEAKQI